MIKIWIVIWLNGVFDSLYISPYDIFCYSTDLSKNLFLQALREKARKNRNFSSFLFLVDFHL